MTRRLLTALVVLASSKVLASLARMAGGIAARAAKMGRAAKEREDPDVGRVYCIEHPDGVFLYGRIGLVCMVLPSGGKWTWRVACGDVRRSGVEAERADAKRVAVETLVSMERIGVQ